MDQPVDDEAEVKAALRSYLSTTRWVEAAHWPDGEELVERLRRRRAAVARRIGADK